MVSTPFTPAFDALTKKTLDRLHIPGVSFSVVHNQHTCTKGYGYAQRDPPKPVDAATLFYAASTTKAHLCAAWALYIASDANTSQPQAQHITFSTPLADIIREDFVLSDSNRTTQVTLEDAVSHRTGLPPHELSYGYGDKRTAKGVTRNLRNLPFANPLRAKFQYCNTPFMAASYALEVVTGKPLAEFLREALWDPLDMQHTYGGYGEASAAVEEKGYVLAKGYTWTKLPSDADEQDGQLVEEPYMDFPEVSGAGWVISTAADYAKWMRCFLDPASGPLSEAVIKEVWTPRTIVPPDDGGDSVPFEGMMSYGLGWFVCMYQGHTLYWHTGGLTGAGSYVVLVPGLKWGVTFLTNGHDGAAKLKGLAIELLDQALGIPEDERTGRERAEEGLLEGYREMAESYRNARSRLYPDAPSSTPTVPLTLPAEAYAGKYRNGAYGPLTFTVNKYDDDGKVGLQCEMFDRTWRNTWAIRHVNAEAWLASRASGSSPIRTAFRVQSKVGVDGRVAGFGVAMEPSMPEHFFWFERDA